MKRLVLVFLLFSLVSIGMGREATIAYMQRQQQQEHADQLGREIIDHMYASMSVMMRQMNFSFLPEQQLKAIKSLVAQGANLNIVSRRTTPLILAVTINEVPLVKLFLENGANVNIKNSEGTNALIEWAQSSISRLEIARILIEHGIDINAQDNKGKTALMYAAEHGYVDKVTLLLDGLATAKRPQISQLAESERNKTYFKLLPPDLIKVIDQYVKIKADPNILSKEGKNAFDYANAGFEKFKNEPTSQDPQKTARQANIFLNYVKIGQLLAPITIAKEQLPQQSRRWWQLWKR